MVGMIAKRTAKGEAMEQLVSASFKPIKVPGPEHPITVERNPKRVVVSVAGRIIADSQNALTLREANYPPVQYIPRKDVDMTLLARTDHATYCPYKGDCAYYSIALGGERSTNAVWSYEAPYDAVAAIEGYLAFYPRPCRCDRGTTKSLITPPFAKYAFGPRNPVAVKDRKLRNRSVPGSIRNARLGSIRPVRHTVGEPPFARSGRSPTLDRPRISPRRRYARPLGFDPCPLSRIESREQRLPGFRKMCYDLFVSRSRGERGGRCESYSGRRSYLPSRSPNSAITR
jgi:uncharacterized protein (DUF427 family)